MKRKLLLLSTLLFLGVKNCFLQVIINEVQITNDVTITDEDGDYEDWIELYNAGSAEVNLSEYGLSDDPQDPLKWQLPARSLAAGDRLLVFASGKDRGSSGPISHYETPVFPWNTWSYIVPSEEPGTDWLFPAYDASGWFTGTGGIGYGDADDVTDIVGPALSVFSRTSFYLTDADAIAAAYLHMDYDDGFVVYLNGVELARVNVGTTNIVPAFDEAAYADHEANGYQDLPYDLFVITPDVFQSALQGGENVFSVMAYNSSFFSTDLTCNPVLSLAMTTSEVQTEISPDWMGFSSGILHTNFKLSAGETLLLSDSNGALLDEVEMPGMQLGHSLQRSGDGNPSWCITTFPTPLAANEAMCADGYAEPPFFELASGMFTGGQLITLTSPDAFAEIRFTSDGSIPLETSMLYSGPFVLDTTAIISARCFSAGMLPSAVKKNTYMIDEWGITLPVVSISTDPGNLWDPTTGIHVLGPPDYDPNAPNFGANFWEDWEREAYMEYFDASHTRQVDGPVGIKIHGGWSRYNTQKSFRIQCKDEYGMESMDYPMIPDKPFITSFKGFNLRNGGNGYWEYRFHDALMQRAFRNTDVDYMAYSPVVVFVNGEYWGFMEMREILDQNWAENNHGINNDDATVVSLNYMGLNVINGDAASFSPMYDYVMNTDPGTENFFETLSQWLDIENYADYIIAETYWCNGDWSNGWINNTKFWHNDEPGGKWRFMLMDMDFGMGLAGNQPTDDYINTAQDEAYYTDQLFSRIIQNEEFRKYFINRYADLINTELQQERIQAMAYAMRDELVDDFPRHCQTWGTDCGTMDWLLDIRLGWNAERIQGARDVVEQHFNLLDQVNLTLDVVPAGAGRIHISTIEPDEGEYPWTGVYYNGVPVRITVVANPGYVFDHWAPNGIFPVAAYLDQFTFNFENDEVLTAYFTGSAANEAIVVSEFMYNDDNEGSDWIELHNTLDSPLDLSGIYLKDNNYFNRFDMPLNMTLQPEEYIVLASDTALFSSQHPGVAQVFGPLNFSLSDSGDEIHVFDHHNQNVINIAYTDDSPWPANSDGTGRSVEFIGESQQMASSYVSGCIGGSPAEVYDPTCGIGVDELAASDDEFVIYPVPSDGDVNLSISPAMLSESPLIQVTDLSGRIVWSKIAGRSLMVISDEALAPGVYHVSILAGDGPVVKPLVKR